MGWGGGGGGGCGFQIEGVIEWWWIVLNTSTHNRAAAKDDEWSVVDSDGEEPSEKVDLKAAAPKSQTALTSKPAAPLFTLPKALAARFTNTLTFALNGQSYTLTNPSPTMKLVEFIREQGKLTGTKIGCGEGGCGACTVVVQSVNAQTKDVVYVYG